MKRIGIKILIIITLIIALVIMWKPRQEATDISLAEALNIEKPIVVKEGEIEEPEEIVEEIEEAWEEVEEDYEEDCEEPEYYEEEYIEEAYEEYYEEECEEEYYEEEYTEEEYYEEPIYEEEIIEEPTEEQEETYTFIGTFDVTAYEWTGNPCANGNYPTEGYTVACNSLPLGTVVYLEGVGIRVVEDRGATWHSDNWLDLYLGDVSACYSWGVRSIDVYIVE